MNSLFIETWNLVGSLLGSVVDIFSSLLIWVWSVLLIVHHDFPRLEGLVIGVVFAWFLIHREKHPYLKVLAAPLKIILDIFDIIVTETSDALKDLLGDTKEKLQAAKAKVFSWLGSLYERTLSGLTRLKGLVSRKMSEEKEEQ